MKEQLICYKRMPVWTKDSLPKMFQEKHNTKEGTWGKITILQGKLKFYVLTEEGDIISEHMCTESKLFTTLGKRFGGYFCPDYSGDCSGRFVDGYSQYVDGERFLCRRRECD